MKKNKFTKIILAIIVSFLFTYVSYNIPYYDIVNTPNIINLTRNDLAQINSNDIFGKFINISSEEKLAVDGTDNTENDIFLKIFNLFPIKKLTAKIYDNKQVFASGELVGFNLKTKGVVVEGVNSVLTNNGEKFIARDGGIKINDVILAVNKIDVTNNEQLATLIDNQALVNDDIEIKLLRDGKEKILNIDAQKDLNTKTYRIGIWVKDETNGIGTLTYVEDDNCFGALGHAITNSNGNVLQIEKGSMYNCNLLGIKKGQKGSAGSVRAVFASHENQGDIEKNCSFGIYGNINEDSNIIESLKNYDVGGRFSARPGKAKIYCNISGEIKPYNVEIIKASSQTKENDKGMVIRIIDKELLKITGGIVQGMSGSPIIQNGKLVGALTHVFVNDPTKGYGVYLDWMLQN